MAFLSQLPVTPNLEVLHCGGVRRASFAELTSARWLVSSALCKVISPQIGSLGPLLRTVWDEGRAGTRLLTMPRGPRRYVRTLPNLAIGLDSGVHLPTPPYRVEQAVKELLLDWMKLAAMRKRVSGSK